MFLLTSLLVASAVCAGDQVDRELHVNDVQVIGTHNSYKQPLPPDELAAHHAVDAQGADSIDYGFPGLTDQLARGVRQVELDVYSDPEGGRYLHPPGARRTGFPEPPWPAAQREAMARPGFKVMHLADIDFRSSCVTWIECLQTLQRWSREHPRHLPVLILVNAKDDRLGPGSAQPLPFDTSAFDRLDAQTRQVFSPDELITPDDVQGHYATLRDAVLAGQWPTLEHARGRFLFVLDEGAKKIAAYQGRRHSLEGRVMFVGAPESSPVSGILVLNDPVAQRERIARAVAAGFLVRTRADADTREARSNDTRRREAAFASGAQFVSTDYFDADPRFGSYQVRLPDGAVARRNPVRGMAECRGATLETDALVLHGTLTGADNQTWRLVPFEVPEGTTRITVDFDYTTRDLRTTIDLGVLGPDGFRGQDGFRGWSGGNKRGFTISATDATPSYLPGAIRPGTWNLLLGVPNIRRDTQAEYTAHVRFDRGGVRAASGPVIRSGSGWYRGDLHMHTAHSDGSCSSRRQQQKVPCPLFLTAQTASERGLDFIAITDHNTMSHADAIRELQPYYDDLLLIPGREITTFEGHANLFGTVATVDFRVGGGDVPDWNALLANVAGLGGVISINHPVRPSGEQCMGCGWTAHGDVDYSRVQGIEVVNGMDADTPFSGIGFWERLLDRGYRITALGGSDNHDALRPYANVAELRQPGDAASPSPETLSRLRKSSGAIGTPTTVIYADELSQAGIVAGIRRGRVFIDVTGTRDRTLDLTATAGSQVAHMGDTLTLARGVHVRFDGTAKGVAGGAVEMILDGKRVPLPGSAPKSFEFMWRADGKRHWIRVDVRDGASHLALVGNPIYLRGPDAKDR
jgi:Phosphoinositide phospholipase C, Ca2+-dependent